MGSIPRVWLGFIKSFPKFWLGWIGQLTNRFSERTLQDKCFFFFSHLTLRSSSSYPLNQCLLGFYPWPPSILSSISLGDLFYAFLLYSFGNRKSQVLGLHLNPVYIPGTSHVDRRQTLHFTLQNFTQLYSSPFWGSKGVFYSEYIWGIKMRWPDNLIWHVRILGNVPDRFFFTWHIGKWNTDRENFLPLVKWLIL